MILITGFPGFIGSRVANELLCRDAGAELNALVEASMVAAAERAADERLTVLRGDITRPRLGLSETDYGRLTSQVTSVYHLAAVYDLAVPPALAHRVNVLGTRHVLELCERCERLERLHYVSTAYVAGARQGRVYEHELRQGQAFKNHYESTKFEAEVLVQKALDRVPATIYRPAIVVGDSVTGETRKFDGPYYMLRVISRCARWRLPIPQFGRAQAPFNVVPVDFVVDAMLAADRDETLTGETLHLVDPEPVSAAGLLEMLAQEYCGRRPAYRLPSGLVETAMRSASVRKLFAGAPREAIRYLNHAVEFDTTHARERLGVHCPPLSQYVEPLVRFFRLHETDPAFAPALARAG